ncbi:G-type lectin S-receptor-like serine/threonine-protein kinase LECRK3 isoform X2 [Daucus carota subsp. sativus]|uniref:G-type lectin S-receptor-like serine/threonine-protein kinase LECRK3 isoform X2 n=1 Tax=Daucus carota subsp. sativus TaxID=79200 RepID=UPI0007EF57C5|nr:PREDICTED: G-type lectin S-receptor-like serine/threonine-protein kinase LECRK3 isoform X2 [Daucus carota subsp. sativus]
MEGSSSYRNPQTQSFDHPTEAILPGQILSNGQELFSSRSESDHATGIFRLKMQIDSNLVLYPADAIDASQFSYWASNTYGVNGVNVALNLEPNGNLYLLNSSATIVKNLTDGFSEKQRVYLLKIDPDGILRLYSLSLDKKGNGSLIVWQSSADRCSPKGVCGLNGFCTLYDNEPQCECVPGFDYVSPGNWPAGCKRNYTVDRCKNNDRRIPYSMRSLENTQWEDDPYSVLKMTTEECRTACLEDCNCEAAFYKDGKCRKQRLPLRYGRRLLTDSNVAYIKWASSTAVIAAAPTYPKTEKKKVRRLVILLICVSLVALAFMVFVIFGFLAYRHQRRAYKKISAKSNYQSMEDIAPRSFTYAELEKVTNGFQEEIGRGASGTIYKGTLEFNNKVVAVKRLEKPLAEGEKEFQNEMKVIGKTHHRNLVRLLGYSHDGPKKLLVYEYMVNGSLADILFDPQHPPRWDERIRIALDIARGILYLHEECETQIIHCDIKPQNVLIDAYRSAKIADFGLAKLLKADQTKTYTGLRGTRGYVAPEWHQNKAVTVKVDVYSFGIMLLEIICCRKGVDFSLSEEEAVLEEWVYQCFQNNELAKLITDSTTNMLKFERMVRVGLWCILDEPSLRPSMKKVLLMLEGTVDIPVPPSFNSYLTAI